jgi:hypothetical protein
MYKLIVNQTTRGPTPYYDYDLKDPKDNSISGVTKAVITIDPNQSLYPKITFQRTWVESESVMEETIEDVPVDIQVRSAHL